jgi:hypothetical protein
MTSHSKIAQFNWECMARLRKRTLLAYSNKTYPMSESLVLRDKICVTFSFSVTLYRWGMHCKVRLVNTEVIKLEKFLWLPFDVELNDFLLFFYCIIQFSKCLSTLMSCRNTKWRKYTRDILPLCGTGMYSDTSRCNMIHRYQYLWTIYQIQGHLLSIWHIISRRAVTEYFLGRQGDKGTR